MRYYAKPYEIYFIEGDFSQSYPYSASTIPSWGLIALDLISPVFIICYVFLVQKSNYTHEIHHGVLSWLEALSLNSIVTESIKYFCGRHRPDYFSRIQNPDISDFEILNGSLSFPSGHTSASFAATVFLFWYLCGKTKVFKQGHFIVLLFIGIPIYLAIWIAITRIHDFKHNYSDIIAGSMIGILSATLCYFLNFKSVFSKHSGEPKTKVIDEIISKDCVEKDEESITQ